MNFRISAPFTHKYGMYLHHPEANKEKRMGRPVVEHFNTNIFLNSVIKAIDLFSVVDPDGDAMASYLVEDYQSDPTGGFFRLNGVAFENGTQFRIQADQLADLEYVSGSRIGREGFRVIAVDVRGEFSTAADSGLLYTVRENVTRPIVSNIPFSALADEATPMAPYIQAFDPDGYPITQYYIRERLENAGFLTFDGVAIPQGEFKLVKTEDLSKLFYNTSGRTFDERFDIFAYDGELWSTRRTVVVPTIENVNRPVAQFSRGTAESREIIDMGPLTNITDDDGNSIKWYEFWNTSPHSVHGELVFKGVVQPRKQWIRVNADELDELKYQAPDMDFVQQIRFRGFDGKFQSGNSTISITTNFVIPPTRPELSNPGLVYDQQLVEYRVDSLFQKVDSGKPYTTYQVYDGNDFGDVSARFEFNNDRLDALTIHEFSAAQADAFLRLRTGDYNNRSTDDIFVRAQNEDGLWSSWSQLEVRTEPEYVTSMDGGNTWFNVPGMEFDTQGRLLLSYSFMQDFPDYETGFAEDQDPPEGEHFTQFTQDQRIATRLAFDRYEELTNVKFVEVSDLSTNVLGQRGGIYRFGNYGVEDGSDGAIAFTFGPSPAPQSADVWFDRFDLGQVFFNADGDYIGHIDPNLDFGTFGYTVLLHELGHTIGQQHTYEDASGTGILPPATRNHNFSVMNGPVGLRRDGVSASTPQLYDVENMHRLYGENRNYNSGDSLYDIAGYWNGRTSFVENIWDGGGIDTLSLEGSDPRVGQFADFTANLYTNKIDLTPGGFSTFNGFNENVSIAFRATIENALGSALADEIIGNAVANVIDAGAGDDVIEGRTGDDMLTGGAGNDVFEFGVGDGNDIIDEKRLAGVDTIRLKNFPTLDSLEDDLRFSMDGRDLIIDLKLDNADQSEGSIRISNQVWGSYRIETLELNGAQIDLKNLTDQVSVTADTFQLTEDTGTYGNLVVPV